MKDKKKSIPMKEYREIMGDINQDNFQEGFKDGYNQALEEVEKMIDDDTLSRWDIKEQIKNLKEKK